MTDHVTSYPSAWDKEIIWYGPQSKNLVNLKKTEKRNEIIYKINCNYRSNYTKFTYNFKNSHHRLDLTLDLDICYKFSMLSLLGLVVIWLGPRFIREFYLLLFPFLRTSLGLLLPAKYTSPPLKVQFGVHPEQMKQCKRDIISLTTRS